MEMSFLEKHQAFSRDSASGRYSVNVPNMRVAVDSLASRSLRVQGDGEYTGVKGFMEAHTMLSPTLGGDLTRLETKKIPVDVVFEQGVDVLGLER